MNKVAYMLGALERGGTETLLLDTLKQASAMKLDCLLIYRKAGTLLVDFVQTGVKLFHLPVEHKFDLTYLLRLRKLLRTEGIQIIHAQLPYDACLAYWASLGMRIPIALTFHGYDYDHTRLAKIIVQFIIHRTDLNVYVSNYVYLHYKTAYSISHNPRKEKVVYNGIDFSKFDKVTNKTIRHELHLFPETLLIGSVGNFVQVRDQLTICRFLAKLHELQIDFHCVFVGTRNDALPALFDDCVAFCAKNRLLDRVHFLGSRNDVPAILNDLDCFVYASNYDTFGIAVVEAMSVGIPVFVNDWPVMQEISENGRWVTIYKTSDINDLVIKFLEYLHDSLKFQQKAALSESFVRQTYSIQRHIQILKESYNALLLTNG